MKSGHPCPKCGATAIERFESVRPGGGPLSVGYIAADAFTMFSQFDAYVCQNCGYTEFYRK
jgi:predicted nucleic-acid-binding Zn-ribbon protein